MSDRDRLERLIGIAGMLRDRVGRGLTLPPGGEELDWQDFVSNGPAGGRHLGRVVPKPHDAATFAVVVPLVPR